MSVRVCKIKKWTKGLPVKSSMHVNQDDAKCCPTERVFIINYVLINLM